MYNFYQQKTICKALGLKKQRIEYLMLKAEIKPVVQADGTGTTNLFDFAGVLSFDIVDCLCMWGFTFPKIKTIMDQIKKQRPELFNNDPEKTLSLPIATDHVMLVVEGIPEKRREGDFPSYDTNINIGTLKELRSKGMIEDLFQKPYGLFVLSLSTRKVAVSMGLGLAG